MKTTIIAAAIVLFSISLIAPAPALAAIFLSDEAWANSTAGRAAASTLDDTWRNAVLTNHPNAIFEQPDNLADEGALTIPPPNGTLEFPAAGLNVAYSVRSMDGPLLGSVETNALPSYTTDQASNPVNFAPVPDDLLGTGVGGSDYTTFFSGNQTFARTAILFEFSTPVRTFGLLLGDVESRPAGVLAEMQLFDTNDSLLNAGSTALVPTGNVIGDVQFTYDVFDNTDIGNVQGQWGNGTTQFYGFVDEAPVSKMLLIVGDEDFGDQALGEHIVFFGATATVPEPTTIALTALGLLGIGWRRHPAGRSALIIFGTAASQDADLEEELTGRLDDLTRRKKGAGAMNQQKYSLNPAVLCLITMSSAMVFSGALTMPAVAQVLYGPDQMTNAAAWGASVAGTGDSAFTFNYDYSADGIPEAPNSQGGNVRTRGVKLEANLVPPGAKEGFALYPLGQHFSGPHRLRFDAWMNYDAVEAHKPPATRFGTTEFLGGGVGYDNFGGAGVFSGAQALASGDGDAHSGPGDWRAHKSPPQFLVSDADMAASTREGSHPYYSDFLPSVDPPVVQVQMATGIAGSPGFQWITWEFTSAGGLVTVDIEKPSGDRLKIVEMDCNDTSDGSNGCTSEGNISLVYEDYFTTVTSRPDLTFGIIDNVVVTTVPEPTGLGSCLLGFFGIIMLRGRWIRERVHLQGV